MPENAHVMKFKLQIAAPAQEVYNALTNANALGEWLCTNAQTDVRKGGRYYLWWESGYYASGEFIQVIPADRVVISWQGRGEPEASRVKASLKPEGDQTKLVLSHTIDCSDQVWEQIQRRIKRGWKLGLENLKSVLETGEDLRLSQRPMLGFTSVQAMSSDEAAAEGLPKIPGLLILGIIPGTFADKTGLAAGDYIVKIAGLKVTSLIELNNFLDQHRAGNKVKLSIYREGKKKSVKGELSCRPMPEIPTEPKALAQAVEKLYQSLNAELETTLQDVDEAWINLGSTPNTWNIRETLGHLIANEREIHAWITRLIEGKDADFTLRANQPVRVHATIAAFPDLAGLIAELRSAQSQTVTMIENLPTEFVSRRRSYWRLALELLQTPPLHYQEHLVLMSRLIDKGRRGQ